MAPLAYQFRFPGWQAASHVPEVPVPGVHVVIKVPVPPTAAAATAGEIVLSASVVKWFTASVVVLWQTVHEKRR
jgi:hypothetical protein